MGTNVLIAIIAAFFGLLLLIRVILNLQAFRSQLRYLNVEIERASPSEVHHWKRRRRKLWLHLFLHPL